MVRVEQAQNNRKKQATLRRSKSNQEIVVGGAGWEVHGRKAGICFSEHAYI
jgi:hypothetical protein